MSEAQASKRFGRFVAGVRGKSGRLVAASRSGFDGFDGFDAFDVLDFPSTDLSQTRLASFCLKIISASKIDLQQCHFFSPTQDYISQDPIISHGEFAIEVQPQHGTLLDLCSPATMPDRRQRHALRENQALLGNSSSSSAFVFCTPVAIPTWCFAVGGTKHETGSTMLWFQAVSRSGALTITEGFAHPPPLVNGRLQITVVNVVHWVEHGDQSGISMNLRSLHQGGSRTLDRSGPMLLCCGQLSKTLQRWFPCP
ncbi:uncharacterized protein PAC_03867 [Phialocephala subalpina]|uniref:Uncharacterized protein n=1 Tax=Phialocephala subalpina TaxID=576137 RepID=A0A1L7WMH4_9HELO|nr:uncharacterized protein PAC_03867 [Phialocephala subalpina]